MHSSFVLFIFADIIVTIFMFSIFKKKQDYDFSFLQTDIHSHILFGLDDGAKTIDDSLQLIKNMRSIGFTSLITSPHVHSDFYPNKKEDILAQLKKVKNTLTENDIDINIRTGAEYMINDGFMELLKKEEDFLTIHNKHILVEMSYLAESPFLQDALFQLQARGYTPILAHPERYNFYHSSYEQYKDLKNRGCLFQLNTIALTGYYGSHVKKTAERLFADGMYDYCGSDMHHMRHFNALKGILSTKIVQTLKEYPFKNREL